MSLILAFRADRKVYFMADRRILSGYTIERDQNKMLVLGRRKDGHAADIVIGVSGEVRMMTILNDPRIQEKLLTAYSETPTIWGLVDAIKEALVSNGIKPEESPGGACRFGIGLLIGIDNELYDIGRALTVMRIPYGEVGAMGSGAELACAFWAGAHGFAGHPGITRYVLPNGSDKYETRAEASTVLLDDNYYRNQLQAVYDYVTRVDSGVGNDTDFYSYPMQVTA